MNKATVTIDEAKKFGEGGDGSRLKTTTNDAPVVDALSGVVNAGDVQDRQNAFRQTSSVAGSELILDEEGETEYSFGQSANRSSSYVGNSSGASISVTTKNKKEDGRRNRTGSTISSNVASISTNKLLAKQKPPIERQSTTKKALNSTTTTIAAMESTGRIEHGSSSKPEAKTNSLHSSSSNKKVFNSKTSSKSVVSKKKVSISDDELEALKKELEQAQANGDPKGFKKLVTELKEQIELTMEQLKSSKIGAFILNLVKTSSKFSEKDPNLLTYCKELVQIWVNRFREEQAKLLQQQQQRQQQQQQVLPVTATANNVNNTEAIPSSSIPTTTNNASTLLDGTNISNMNNGNIGNKDINEESNKVSNEQTLSQPLQPVASGRPIEKQQSTNGASNKSEFPLEYEKQIEEKNPVRKIVIQKLAKVFYKVDQESGSKCVELATSLENCLFEAFGGTTSDYKTQVSEITYCLRDEANPEFRSKVLSGELSFHHLCKMSAHDMASLEKKMELNQMEKDYFREISTAENQSASTDMFKCSKCKQRKCTYYQLQTRSADEPMTTFVTCCHCGNRWKSF